MAEISASLVRELREITGLGMMECKRALTEAGGDLKKAEELLRIKSGAKASKAAGRIAAEGVIGSFLSPDGKLGALVELNCETDFVAKNTDFLDFAASLAQLAATRGAEDAPALGAVDGVEHRRQGLLQKIGENITIRRVVRLGAQHRLACYVHGGRIGVLVDIDGTDETGKDVAMHVAFAKPAYLTIADVPEDVVARERAILAARAQEAGKTPEIAARMVEGGLNKFLGELTLFGQAFIKDDKLSVGKMLAAKNSKVLGFRFLVVGEGIERKAADFAAEVMATAGMAR